jgi:ubiquinone/menaquinone biosynthesis C-methylase UbiE
VSGSLDNVLTNEARYRPVLAAHGWSVTLNEIWRDTYGDDYPEDVEPLGFSTLSDLDLMRRWLGVGTGESIVDLGCGRGGPGLWLARATGTSLVGIDIVPEAIEEAARRAALLRPPVSARFQVGDFRHTGLPGAAFEGAVSVDSIWMVLDKVAAIREVRRLLMPGGRWVLSTWEPGYLSYTRLLDAGGWEVLACHEPALWYDRQQSVYQKIIAAREQLAAEIGQEAAQVLVTEAREIAPQLREYQRLLIVARC